MRVSVSRRSKNFPRPTSSSDFLSHLASTREALFFSLQPWSKSWTIPSWKRGFFSRSNRGSSTLISMSMLYGWIANLKRALLLFSSLVTTVQGWGGSRGEEVGSKDAILSAPRLSPRRLFILFSEGKVWFMSAGPGGKIIVLVPRNEAGCLFLDDRR